MLDVTVTADDYELSGELRRTAIEKIGALDEYMKGIQTAHVVFSWEGGPGKQTSVHAQVDGGGHRFEASDIDWEALTALDKTRHELASQLRRQKSKEIDARDHGQ
ncbi:MAG: HPF/RaiA family ribosome-associated protein [Verrucomicrobiales bacterium]